MFRSGGILASGKRVVARVVAFATDIAVGDIQRRIRQLSRSIDVLEHEINERLN